MAQDLPEHLVQYTNAEAPSASSALARFGQAMSFLNADQEFLEAYEQAIALFWPDPTFKELGKRARKLHDLMRTNLKPVQPRGVRAVFVASFSEQFNDLSQWRGLHAYGDGYSVVFD